MANNKGAGLVRSGSAQWEIIIKAFSKIVLILLAFVPLIVDDNVIFPYISGKMVAIRISITLVVLLILIGLVISKHFRKELYSKVYRLLHNPIFITTGTFMFFIALSVVFAVDKYRAFFGNVERAEGLMGILFYFAFFPLAYLIFSRKDWLWFFKASLATGLVLFVNEVMSIPADSTAARPGSFTGNPSFLAGYFLFVIAAAMIVFYESRHERRSLRISWQVGSSLMILLSVIGIFITQTRGTILGLAAGVVVLAIYWAVKGKGIVLYKGLSLRNLSVIMVSLLVISAGFFIMTSSDSFWQKVPGMSRFAEINSKDLLNDNTVQTRLISIGIGLKAMNPVTNGPVRFLFGWGQENFDIAYNQYYNPVYLEHESQWFDRAHNKIMDVLVMNGVLGLLSYIALWVSFAWIGFRKKEFSPEKMALLFFASAFFVNLLALFDQISTYIPLFAALGFMAYLHDEHRHEEIKDDPNDIHLYLLYTAVALIFVFFAYVLSLSLITYTQMKQYVGLLQSNNLTTISDGIDGVLYPYSYGQQDIRGDLVGEISGQYSRDPSSKPLLDKAISAEEEVISLDPHDPRQSLMIGETYDLEGRVAAESASSSPAESLTYFKEAEQYYREALALAPERQDVLLPTAQNLFYQGRLGESIALLQQAYNEDPKIVIVNYELGMVEGFAGQKYYSQAMPLISFALEHYANNLSQLGDTSGLIRVYQSFAGYFYNQRDTANFVAAMNGLNILEPYNSSNIAAAISAAKAGNWSGISPKSL